LSSIERFLSLRRAGNRVVEVELPELIAA